MAPPAIFLRREFSRFYLLFLAGAMPGIAKGQSADWQNVIYREPQVRYLLADMCLGGGPNLYRKYATEEKDPDSREAIRLWDAGVRVLNPGEFERKKIAGKVLITRKGSDQRIRGREVKLSSD